MTVTPNSTRSVVKPIVHETYGKGSMSNALVAHLAEQIDSYDGNDREGMIRATCWTWFSGGDTAASVARKIEEALKQCH